MAKKSSAKKRVTKPKVVISIIYHYEKDDPNCNGDYYDIELQQDGKIIAEYGDYYHDKGSDKAEAFIQGVEHVLGVKVKAIRMNVADRDK